MSALGRWRTVALGALVVAALALVVAVLVLARGDDDGRETGPPETAAELAEVLRADYDMTEQQAQCVADQVFSRLDAEELEAIRRSGADGSPVPDDIQAELRTALAPCA